ncbi:Hypothetical predicted protein [Cloeon dipterum]|uniref:Reverse transcriptase domain-containing protein n=1 Tax=Cloeon dipterum TaxID=197152 RepID=A0A8S1EBD6_9INSE|nr:Hypothetical predicted protein [Cloeon dipterum]
MEADGWKKVARRKKRRETAAGQGSDRHDPASKVVKARAGSKRGASAARAPAACTAKASLSGTRSHTPPACSTGRLVSSSPPADTGGVVPPRVHLSSISSPESHVQKEAEPEASHQKDDTGAKNKSPILKTKAQGNRRDRAVKSVKVCAGSQRGASAARGPEACTAQVDVHAGARSLTPPASSTGRLVSSPPAAAGGAEIPLAQILPNSSPETHAELKMSNQKDVCADNDIDWESEAQDDRRDRAVKPVKAIAGSKRAVSAGGAVFSDTDEGSVSEVPVKLTAKRMTLREYADYIKSEREKEGEEKAGERTANNAENPLINMRPRRKNNRKSDGFAAGSILERFEFRDIFFSAKRAYRVLCKKKKADFQELQDRKILLEAEAHCHRFLRLNGSSSESVANDINMDMWARFLGGLFNSQGLRQGESLNLRSLVPSYSDEVVHFGFLKTEIELALGGMKNKKAPGPDNLQNEVVKLLWAAVPDEITAFLNVCLELGSFPHAWKKSNLKLLYKGKGGVSDVDSYRGISLCCSLYNLLDRVMKNRLYSRLIDLIPSNQFGFVKGRSTIQAVQLLVDEINFVVYEKKTPLYALFLDVKKAFDSVSRHFIFEELVGTGRFSVRELNLLAEMLDANFLTVRDGVSVSEPIVQSNGLFKISEIDPEFYGAPAMVNPSWKSVCYDMRHALTRHACHDFHFLLCKTKNYHSSAIGECVCKFCDKNIGFYHFFSCDKNEMSLAQAANSVIK